jgi:hypothetical protein
MMAKQSTSLPNAEAPLKYFAHSFLVHIKRHSLENADHYVTRSLGVRVSNRLVSAYSASRKNEVFRDQTGNECNTRTCCMSR